MMAVCKLAVITFADNYDIGGYSIGDLHDCIAMGRANIECGYDHIAYVKVDIPCFIKWAKHKIKVLQIEGKGKL